MKKNLLSLVLALAILIPTASATADPIRGDLWVVERIKGPDCDGELSNPSTKGMCGVMAANRGLRKLYQTLETAACSPDSPEVDAVAWGALGFAAAIIGTGFNADPSGNVTCNNLRGFVTATGDNIIRECQERGCDMYFQPQDGPMLLHLAPGRRITTQPLLPTEGFAEGLGKK